jgi:NAD(P)-dependent dehydrogenase (short-subunit alcohol dehydrogenase family)
MKGKIVLITGATDGIGIVAAREIARMGANITLVGRNREKTAATARNIQAETGNTMIAYLVGDLSSQAEVRRVAQEFLSLHDHLDVLINNAGAVFMRRQLSVDGYEKTFALNHLAYFLLTNLLLDALKASTAGRIVSTSSNAHTGGSINFADLQLEHGWSGWKAYSQSKLANIYFTTQLAENLKGTNITANCLHPGFVATNFGRSNGGVFNPVFKVIQSMAAISPEEGAKTIIYLATSPNVEGLTGKYFSNCEETAPSAKAKDMAAARQLWDVSLEMTGLAVEKKR